MCFMMCMVLMMCMMCMMCMMLFHVVTLVQAKSKLDPALKSLTDLIFDVKAMTATGVLL